MMQPIVSRKRSRSACNDTEKPSKIIKQIHSALPIRMMEVDENDLSPQQYLMQIVKSQNVEAKIEKSLDLQGYFSEYTEEEVEAYDADVLRAIRTQDIDTLREYHNNGRPLKCSNGFGESLLHLACRRNFVDVVKFLVHEAHVPVRVRDDYGRTILHDAFWTCEPSFELVKLILTECPDLLFMSDRRGHTPLLYVRKSHWCAWKKFLAAESDCVLPSMISRKSLQ